MRLGQPCVCEFFNGEDCIKHCWVLLQLGNFVQVDWKLVEERVRVTFTVQEHFEDLGRGGGDSTRIMVGQYSWDVIPMGLMVSARDGIDFVDVVRRLHNVRGR